MTEPIGTIRIKTYARHLQRTISTKDMRNRRPWEAGTIDPPAKSHAMTGPPDPGRIKLDQAGSRPVKRFALMRQCFDLQLPGCRTETDLPEEMPERLPLFIGMALIGNIADEPECCVREGEGLDREDIEDAAECLVDGMPYAGFGGAT